MRIVTSDEENHQAMKLNRVISTVEVHTGGEPFRIVTSGLPHIPGNTIVERRTWVREHAERCAAR